MLLDVWGFPKKQNVEHRVQAALQHLVQYRRDQKCARFLIPSGQASVAEKNYMNDSFRTNVFVRFSPETIACACIDLASRQLQIPLPANPLWYPLFDVTGDSIREICLAILRLYARKKPDPDKLEAVVNEAKKLHIEAKLKAKGLSSDGGTPISTSRPGTPTKVSPSPLAISKHKSEDDKSDSSAGRVNHNSRKKRGHSASDDSRSRSRSRSPRDKSRSRTPYSSRSRSTSHSPVAKRKYRDSPKKHKKDSSHHNVSGDKGRSGRHKTRQHSSSPHSRSHSIERSPVRKYKKVVKKHRSRSRTPDRERHKISKYRSRSRSRERSRKSKKHNGHRRSRSHDRYRR